MTASIFSRAKEDGVETAKEQWMKCPLFKPILERGDEASLFMQIVSGYSGWHFINKDPVRSLEPPAIERLKEISVPTLIIIGERDLEDFHRIADTLEKNIQNAQRITLQGVGHMSSMEAPEEFNETVLNFLANL